MASVRWDYGIPGMVDAALALADLQAKGCIKFVSEVARTVADAARLMWP
jgi:hypothetical protein